MKRICTFIAAFFVTLLLVSCASMIPVEESNSNSVETQTTNPPNSTEPVGQIVKPVVKTTGSELSLDGIKKAAQDLGYAVEDVQDMQINIDPSPTNGFNVIYEDEYSASHIPIYEFENSEDALVCAQQINEEGYSRCIINENFLTMTGADYGVVRNDNEKGLLEKLLKSTVMQYAEPQPIPLIPSKDYAGAFVHTETIRKALDKLINRSVLLYDKTLPQDDPKRAGNAFFSPISSGDLGFTGSLCEEQTQLDAVKQLWEMFGCTDFEIQHDAANEYVLKGKRAGLDTTFEIHCAYFPETGALRLVEDGEEVKELFEFVSLGSDTYAFQTLYERAIVEYKDSKIISFVYSLNKRDPLLAYHMETDSIYPYGEGVDETWVSNAEEDSYEQFITYDGTKLVISADSFFGERLKVEIDVK